MQNWKNWCWSKADHPWACWYILANLTLVTFIAVSTVVAPNVAASHIRGDIKLSSDDMRWISIGYIMMLGLVLPLGIWLAEKFGYKKILLMGIGIFITGPLVATFNWNFFSTMIGRSLAGIGAGIIMPLSNAIIVKETPLKYQAIALALYVGIGLGVSTGVGFYFGGWCTQILGWRWLFALIAIAALPFLITTFLFHRETEANVKASFDNIGYLLFVIFIICLLLVINSGKAEWNTEGWRSPFIIICSIIGALSLLILIPWELQHSQPLIPLVLFKSQTFLLGVITVAFAASVIYINTLLGPVVTVEILQYEPLMAGRMLLTFGVFTAIASVSVVYLTPIIGVRWLAIFGMTLLGIGCIMNSAITLYSSHMQFQIAYNLRGLGMIFALGPATALAMSEIPKNLAGPASVVVVLFRQVCGTIGTSTAEVITIQRSVFHNQMFGTQINTLSPRFQQVVQRMQNYFIQNRGADQAEAAKQAKAFIRENIMTQSQYTATNDAYYIFGVIILVITSALLLQLGIKYIRGWLQKNV